MRVLHPIYTSAAAVLPRDSIDGPAAQAPHCQKCHVRDAACRGGGSARPDHVHTQKTTEFVQCSRYAANANGAVMGRPGSRPRPDECLYADGKPIATVGIADLEYVSWH